MGETPEGKIKRKLREKLRQLPACYVFMPVQTGLGASTLDYLCCVNGHFVAIETKAPGRQMTARQQVVMHEMLEAGAHVFLVDSEEGIDQCIARLALLESVWTIGDTHGIENKM